MQRDARGAPAITPVSNLSRLKGRLHGDAERESALDAAFVELLGERGQPHAWQHDAALEALRGRDVFVRAATGSGKTVVFQAVALAAHKLRGQYVLVVSPLVLLLQDQVQKLNQRVPGAAAMAMPSVLEKRHACDGPASEAPGAPRDGAVDLGADEELRASFLDATRTLQPSPYKVLYMTPEKLTYSRKWRAFLCAQYAAGRIAANVFDECHVVVSWGRTFRPAYLDVTPILEAAQEQATAGEAADAGADAVPVLALTATATANAQKCIARALHMSDDYAVFETGVNRPQLFYEVIFQLSCINDAALALKLAERIKEHIEEAPHGEKVLVFALRPDTAKTFFDAFVCNDIPCVLVHGGLSFDEKVAAKTEWESGSAVVAVGTGVLALGIDHPHITLVIFARPPLGCDELHQQSGRAGRASGLLAQVEFHFAPYQIHSCLQLAGNDATVAPALAEVVGFFLNETRCLRAQINDRYESAQRGDAAAARRTVDCCSACYTAACPDTRRTLARDIRGFLNGLLREIAKYERERGTPPTFGQIRRLDCWAPLLTDNIRAWIVLGFFARGIFNVHTVGDHKCPVFCVNQMTVHNLNLAGDEILVSFPDALVDEVSHMVWPDPYA